MKFSQCICIRGTSKTNKLMSTSEASDILGKQTENAQVQKLDVERGQRNKCSDASGKA